MATASAMWLPATRLSRPLLRFLHLRTCFQSTNRRFSSAGRPIFPPKRPMHTLLQVSALAKRGFSAREDEVASTADLSFEEPLKVLEYPDPLLRARNKRIVTFDDQLKKLVNEMFDVMYKTDGIGLSAPQVGINVKLMVFNPVGERGEGEEVVLINPRINGFSKKRTLFDEGCLSFPEIYADVERPESVKIDALDINGKRFNVNLSGLPARVFQHEFDHLQNGDEHIIKILTSEEKLQGILFFERMTEEVLDSIRTQLEALETKYEDKTGLPSPERISARQRRTTAAGFGKS